MPGKRHLKANDPRKVYVRRWPAIWESGSVRCPRKLEHVPTSARGRDEHRTTMAGKRSDGHELVEHGAVAKQRVGIGHHYAVTRRACRDQHADHACKEAWQHGRHRFGWIDFRKVLSFSSQRLQEALFSAHIYSG